jgi:hypothetical protein
MTVILQGSQLRTISLGNGPVQKSTGTLAATTIPLFTIAGGEVMITAMWGKVTTSVTVANTYLLQFNPTTGDTAQLATSVDIGTTDTLAGSLITFGLATATAPPKLMSSATAAGGYGTGLLGTVLSIGQIEHTSGGTDGVILWNVMWVPLTDGATLVAA